VSLHRAIGLTEMAIRHDVSKSCQSVLQSSGGWIVRRGGEQDDAFTLTELLISLFVVGLLAGLFLPALSHSKSRAKEGRCISNLKQIYTGFLIYQSDNGYFPGGIRWQGKLWTSATFFGGKTGHDTGVPPAQARPLFGCLAPGDVFRCPADVGIDATNEASVLLEPSLFEVWGLSYWYHAAPGKQLEPLFTDGLAGRKMEWVKRPSAYVLAAEPPAVAGGSRKLPSGVDGQMMSVYWHRARRPGTGDNYADGERGPRVSPFLFVDGHVKFYDCTGQYTSKPTFPGEVEFEQ
jgi:prepilin-type N-terminal cleavage/methylation domain-containing protein/prepilin-type processing-associated H-X9-DG protein